jgi:intron-binding protein aquarius
MQLPPVVKHSSLRQFSKLEQSLFTRFIRLGVPTIKLDQQGRSRPSIASLYSWRYLSMYLIVIVLIGIILVFKIGDKGNTLGNLKSVLDDPLFRQANAGFLHTHQIINVPDFQEKGETCPTPFFYQNLGEAEYIVAVYQYMRLLGYPASKISILTTYNGQKNLISDIISQRCQNSPLFGSPASISTVDQYQGQQNY